MIKPILPKNEIAAADIIAAANLTFSLVVSDLIVFLIFEGSLESSIKKDSFEENKEQ